MLHQKNISAFYAVYNSLGYGFLEKVYENAFDYRIRLFLNSKGVKEIIDAHEAQLVNYLKATKIKVGLLLNFGTEAKFKRKIFTQRKK